MKLTNLGELNGSTVRILNAAQEQECWRKGLAYAAWFWRDAYFDTLSLAIVEAIIPMAQPVEPLEQLLPPNCSPRSAASPA